jgi:hypothetical protein
VARSSPERYGAIGGDKVTFELTSPATGTTHTYDRFAAVLKDTIDARIYMGIHFRTPDVQGALLGKKVAQWVASTTSNPSPDVQPASAAAGSHI